MNTSKTIKAQILNLVEKYYQIAHSPTQAFIPGKSRVNYAGRYYNHAEIKTLVSASLDFWLTNGPYTNKFETSLAKFLKVKHALIVNSGSSANLLAFMSLTSPLLGKRRLQRGDEVITVAAGFPTTVSPIIQYGCVPVFVDVLLETGNINVKLLQSALSAKTKAVMIAHTLGNPFDLEQIKQFCTQHNLWLIEDNCDALGSTYNNKLTGTFGDIGTSSFYPAHHITTGEGGAVYTNNLILKKIMLSIRDWGRDCWCESGQDNTCGKRFEQQHGKLPFGYDHKFVYSHFGYNLKATDLQAAIGYVQLKKINKIIKIRQNHHRYLYQHLKPLDHFFMLPSPTPNSNPSWFGFLITVKQSAPFSRNQLTQYLAEKQIQTRNLFAGNLTQQPIFTSLIQNKDYRIVGKLTNTNTIMNQSFWIGVYPGLTKKQLKFVIATIKDFVLQHQ